MSDNCNINEFLSDCDIVSFNTDFRVTGAELYSSYSVWCGDNALTALKRDTFISWLKTNQKKLGICYDSNILDDRGNRVRGFKGIKTNRKTTCVKGVSCVNGCIQPYMVRNNDAYSCVTHCIRTCATHHKRL